jgi:hypothetical protein
MDIGMLWFCNDNKMSLTAKIAAGLAYYKDKYGQIPNQVLINPKTLGVEIVSIPGVSIETRRKVLPNHFLIGVSVVPKRV